MQECGCTVHPPLQTIMLPALTTSTLNCQKPNSTMTQPVSANQEFVHIKPKCVHIEPKHVQYAQKIG